MFISLVWLMSEIVLEWYMKRRKPDSSYTKAATLNHLEVTGLLSSLSGKRKLEPFKEKINHDAIDLY